MSEKPSLLAVGSEEDLLDDLEQAFGRDYLVSRAGSAKETLAELRGKRPQVIIMEERLPDRSGLDLLDELREAYPDIARVLLSGFSNLSEVAEATRAGRAHAYVAKPVDPPRLRAAVAEARARQERGDWQT